MREMSTVFSDFFIKGTAASHGKHSLQANYAYEQDAIYGNT